MQQVINDKVKVQIPFLGGVDEQVEVINQPPEEFLSAKGLFPQFSGMLARMPGKVGIRKETTAVRSIHQTFAAGSFAFYIESDRLLFCNDCANPRYTVKPAPPSSLGTDDDNFTLDVFGGSTKGLAVPLSVPNLNFSPVCFATATEEDPDPDPDPGDFDGVYILQTDYFKSRIAFDQLGLVILSFQHSGSIDFTYQLEEGIDFPGGGEPFDFSSYVEMHQTGLEKFFISEGAWIADPDPDNETPVNILSATDIEKTDENELSLVGAATWAASGGNFTLGKYFIDTTNFPQDGTEIEVDWVYLSGTVFGGPQWPMGTYTVGDLIDITDAVYGSLTFFGSPLLKMRFKQRLGAVKTLIPITIERQEPSGSFTITSTSGVLADANRSGPTGWTDVVILIVGFDP